MRKGQVSVNSDHYAIVIGIRDYPKFTPLLGAHNDAAAFIEWLKSPTGGGLPEGNITAIFSDESNAANYPNDVRPVHETIDTALEMLGLPDTVPVGTRLYFYFAGHGFGNSFDEIGLLMANAGPNALNANIGLNLYRRYFRDHPHFNEIVYILDCCRDPAPATKGTAMVPPRFTAPVADDLEDIQDFVIMGAAYRGRAWQGTSAVVGKRRGILTTALLEGLGGMAADAQGNVTADSLRDFLHERVRTLTEDMNMEQSPAIDRPHGTSPFVFCSFPTAPIEPTPVVPPEVPPMTPSVAPPTVPIAIKTAGLKGELIVRHGDFTELMRLNLETTKGKVWRFDLPAGSRYAIQHMPSNRFFPFDPKEQNGKAIVLKFD